MKIVPKIFHELWTVEKSQHTYYALTPIHKPTKTTAAKNNCGYASALLWPLLEG